jgi:hypothetical protein
VNRIASHLRITALAALAALAFSAAPARASMAAPASMVASIASTAITQTMPDQAKADLVKGLFPLDNVWVLSTAYVVGDKAINGGNVYRCITAGTSASSGGPTTTSADITDNTVHWQYLEGAHVLKIALYTSSATLGASSTVYSTTNEVTGTGYTAGGNTLTSMAIAVASNHANVDFADSAWTSSTITARGALIYDSTAGNRIIGIYDFGADKTSTSGTFTVAISTGVLSIQ